MALLMFYGVGLTFIIKGVQSSSISGACIGGLFVWAGIYYSVRWFKAED